MTFRSVGNVVIPTDEVIFFRMIHEPQLGSSEVIPDDVFEFLSRMTHGNAELTNTNGDLTNVNSFVYRISHGMTWNLAQMNWILKWKSKWWSNRTNRTADFTKKKIWFNQPKRDLNGSEQERRTDQQKRFLQTTLTWEACELCVPNQVNCRTYKSTVFLP